MSKLKIRLTLVMESQSVTKDLANFIKSVKEAIRELELKYGFEVILENKIIINDEEYLINIKGEC